MERQCGGIPLVQWDNSFFKSLEEQDVLSPIFVGYWTGRWHEYAGVELGKGAVVVPGRGSRATASRRSR
eukprot:9857722-Heterocapsa_arctica.AAC.1